MKITFNEIKNMVNESVERILSEGWKPIYRNLPNGDYDYDGDSWDGVDDEEEEDDDTIERKRIIDSGEYHSYVLVDDSDGAILDRYTPDGPLDGEAFDQAMEDAKEKARMNKNGSYSVYGCIYDEYDDDTLLYNTTEGYK